MNVFWKVSSWYKNYICTNAAKYTVLLMNVGIIPLRQRVSLEPHFLINQTNLKLPLKTRYHITVRLKNNHSCIFPGQKRSKRKACQKSCFLELSQFRLKIFTNFRFSDVMDHFFVGEIIKENIRKKKHRF